MALVATTRPPMAIGALRGQVRIFRVLLFALLTLGLMVGSLQLPPVLPAGADLANSAQRLYAENLWPQVQVSLLLICCFLPWLSYALLWRGAARGAGILAGVSLAGTLVATWLTVITVGAYLALPATVSGVVILKDSRTIQLDGGRTYYLALSESQIASSSSWLKGGASVRLWVSPRGQVGAIEPATSADAG